MLNYFDGNLYTPAWRVLMENVTLDEAANAFPEVTITLVPTPVF
jgi:hypothetical protein